MELYRYYPYLAVPLMHISPEQFPLPVKESQW